MKNRYLLFLFLIINISAQSQTKDYYGYKNEIGFNATEVLGNLLSLTGSTDDLTQYSVFVRKHFDSYTLRFDLSGSYDRETTFGFSRPQTVLTNTLLSTRIGFEKLETLGKRFAIGYGLDALFIVNRSKSTNTGFDVLVQNNTLGAGPVFRLHYRLGKRIVLSTESTLYAGAVFRKQENSGNAPPPSKATDFFVQVKKPQSLSLSILF